MQTTHQKIIHNADFAAPGAAETAIRAALTDFTRRETLRLSARRWCVAADRDRHEDRWNDDLRNQYCDLVSLCNALTDYETALWQRKDADVLARIADAIIAAWRIAQGETPTPPRPTRTVDVRCWRGAQTVAELQSHLAQPERAAKVAALQTPIVAPEKAEAQAPASTRVAPVSRAGSATPKSPRAAQMARFWAVVAEERISGSDSERRAFATAYLNKPVATFSDLNAEEIGRLADAVRRGEVENGFTLRADAWAVAA